MRLETENAELHRRLAEQQASNGLLKDEILWVIEDVWPIVHGLTCRETLRKRFKRLPDILSAHRFSTEVLDGAVSAAKQEGYEQGKRVGYENGCVVYQNAIAEAEQRGRDALMK
jgi:hypothetical protein